MAANTAVKALDRPEPTALGEIVNAELTKQIETAKRFPRDENAALRQLQDLACRSDPVAESCMYTLKRKDKDGNINWITGPSVRFAELLAYVWGNLRAGARIIEEAEFHVVAQGIAYDLQRNTGLMVEVRRGIRTSGGARFGADMINVTSNAACSIALRNAVFDCVPQVLWWDVYEVVKHKAVGAAQIPERLQKAVQFFVSKGATEKDILKAMDVKKIADMSRDHLEIFIGLQTALKEGTIKAETIFTAEAKEERAKLSLVAEEDQFNSIDKQVAGKKDGAGPQEAPGAGAARQAPIAAQQQGGEKAKAKGGKVKADSAKGKAKAAAPDQDATGDDGQPADSQQPRTEATGAEAKSSTGETDAELVERVEDEWKAEEPAKKDRPIKKARADLERIAKGQDKQLASRASKLLNLYDLDDPQE